MCEVCLLSGVSEFLSVPGQEVKKRKPASRRPRDVSAIKGLHRPR